ncbi:MAG: methyltransferase, partial [Tateyamaria sp.]
GVEPVDGTDISPDMTAVAEAKGMYRATRVENILDGLSMPDGAYQGAVSSGTFTNGHVGPDGMDAILDVVRPGAWIVLSVNSRHFDASGFDAKLALLEPHIDNLFLIEVAIYGPNASGPHARDTARLVAFRRA